MQNKGGFLMTVYPTATHGIISRMTDSFFSYHGWPTVCRSDDGTLYAVCSGFRLQHVCPFGKTVMFVSFDEGIQIFCIALNVFFIKLD